MRFPIPLILAFAAAGLAAGCAVDRAARRDVADLRRQLDAARDQAQRSQATLRELGDRMFLLEDRLETAEVGASRTPDLVPHLPVVQKRRPAAVASAEAPFTETAGGAESVEVMYEGEAARQAAKRPELRLSGLARTDDTPPVDREPMPSRRSVIRDAEEGPTRTGGYPRPGSVTDRIPVTDRVPPIDGGAPAPPGELATYRSAFAALSRRDHAVAIAGFQAFLARFPANDYADNAQYWLAEAFYDLADFPTALAEFRKVVERYPEGNKAPDALLKIGYCYAQLGDGMEARDVLNQVARIYPKTDAARLATERLAAWPR